MKNDILSFPSQNLRIISFSSEVKQFLTDLGQQADERVIKKLMAEVDTDGDGKVDFKGMIG